MKKFILILGLVLILNANARAEIYHGIDITSVYESSDWNNKKDIKKIIDDYALLAQYHKELSLCSHDTERLLCMDKLAEDIIKHFYAGNIDDNLNNYHNYVKATSSAYGIV